MTEPVLEYEPILRKEAERKLVEKMRQIALEGCTEEIKQFAECAKGRTLSVAWKCREPSQVARACMDKYKQDEELRLKMRLKHAEKYPRSVMEWRKCDKKDDA